MPTLFTALRAQHTEKPHRARIPEASSKATEEIRRAPLLRADLAKLFSSQASSLSQLPAGEVVAPEEISTVAGPAVNLPKRKIAVVGAGLSGLAAAYELNGLGYDVIVFEARPRVGGRVVMFECLGPFATVRGQTCEPNV